MSATFMSQSSVKNATHDGIAGVRKARERMLQALPEAAQALPEVAAVLQALTASEDALDALLARVKEVRSNFLEDYIPEAEKPELCAHGSPQSECSEIDPCELGMQEDDAWGDLVEESMGLRNMDTCRGCSGTCCTGVGSDPCTC